MCGEQDDIPAGPVDGVVRRLAISREAKADGVREVNFKILESTYVVTLDPRWSYLRCDNAVRLVKFQNVCKQDRWSIKDADAELSLRHFSFAAPKHLLIKSGVATIGAGRYENFVDIFDSGGRTLPVDPDQPVELRIKYTKPLVRGLNYERIEGLQTLHQVCIETMRFFNECDHLRYRICIPTGFQLLSSLPGKYAEVNHNIVFTRNGLRPEEASSLFMTFSPSSGTRVAS